LLEGTALGSIESEGVVLGCFDGSSEGDAEGLLLSLGCRLLLGITLGIAEGSIESDGLLLGAADGTSEREGLLLGREDGSIDCDG